MARRRLPWLIALALTLVLFAHFCVRIVPPAADPPAVPARSSRDDNSRALVIPVEGIVSAQLVDTFTQSRQVGERQHNAMDIMAPRGTPVRAAAAGRVEKLFVSEQGGNAVYVRSRDGRWLDYYAHLDRYRPGLREGQWVGAGDLLGTVGSTGNADPAGPHLHYAINRMQPGEKWYEGAPVNPYPMLKAGAR